jgi:hypothetical protein
LPLFLFFCKYTPIFTNPSAALPLPVAAQFGFVGKRWWFFEGRLQIKVNGVGVLFEAKNLIMYNG